jgi:hypothetical protein
VEGPGSPSPRDGLGKRAFMALTEALDRRYRWDRLPLPLGLATLIGLRMTLRRKNLFDSSGATVSWGPTLPPPGPRPLTRSTIGRDNDLEHPQMGSAGMPFGRNVPLDVTYRDDVLKPSPRTVSLELLARRDFIPARTLNVLAAAWLQFEVHDWMSHGSNPPDGPWTVELDDDDPWPTRPMEIQRTNADPADGGPPTYRNTEAHWWDGSQVYGNHPDIEEAIRTGHGGKVRLDASGVIPFDPTNPAKMPKISGLSERDAAAAGRGWWLGLAMLHTLFMREHNSVCDHLARANPGWSDDELFDHARLVIAALIAKIHMVEWTPALLATTALRMGMKANWWGFQGPYLHKWFGRLSKNEEVSGIPGSELYHHGVPFSMTEEFVAVYRMHPLMPDDFRLRSWSTDRLIEHLPFSSLAGKQTGRVLEDGRMGMPDFFYSMGTSHPGAIVLHNYPRELMEFTLPDGTVIDLAAVDILRNREHGVPRYNEFRRRFHLPPAARFEDFSDDPEVVADLRRIYGDPEAVDLMVGLYAEKPPEGFAFSDTAFRVFILMASRRLKSDRFYTYDYRPEVYTPEGMRWIADNTMSSVITRHYPQLAGTLRRQRNAFAPWRLAGA